MTLKQAKRLVNPTLQVITSRKDKNMPKTKQAKGKARWIGEWCLNGGHDPNNPWPLGSLPARPITKLVEISSKLVVKPPKQEWEKTYDSLWQLDGQTHERIRRFIQSLLASRRERIIKRVSEMKWEKPKFSNLTEIGEVRLKTHNQALSQAITAIKE